MTNAQRLVLVGTCWAIAAVSCLRTVPADSGGPAIWTGPGHAPPGFFSQESNLPYVVGRYVLPIGFVGLGLFFLVGWRRR